MTHPVKLGKYQIKRELGSGAMGVVYEAFDPLIERTVALKTIRKSLIDQSENQEFVLRFKREAQAAGRLTHPNIVSVYDYSEDQELAFIAMEFVQGKTLKDYFDENIRFEIKDVIHIVSQLLDALAYSHKQGVIHRDIKPANIILMADKSIKVADFGIARIESSQLTQTGAVLGTAQYMSPEQFEGHAIDNRSDLFSVGVVLYQLLTGEKPFDGASTTTIMYKVLTAEPPLPSKLNIHISSNLDAVVKKALAKRPDDRFQSGAEFVNALKSTDSRAMIPAGDATLLNISGPVTKTVKTPSPPRATAQTVTVRQAKSSAAIWVVLIGLAMIIGLGSAAYFAFQRLKSSATENLAKIVPPDIVPAAATTSAVPAIPSTPIKETPSAIPPITAATDPGILVISAVGFADPSDKKDVNNTQLQAEARADAKAQLIEKAIALYIDRASLMEHYSLLNNKLLNHSGVFIKDIVQEEQPWLGKDGLMHATTRAKVKVKEVQKSLNQMTKEDRIGFIRNNGDPKIAVSISLQREQGDTQRSPVAENALKERIKVFGYRIWDADVKGADFKVSGEAKIKKLSAKLTASGITIEKFTLTSWTVKCVDQQTGEEIYYNTKMPSKNSWANEDLALAEIGKLIGDEFSKDFFAQHFNVGTKAVNLLVQGLPSRENQELLQNELLSMRTVVGIQSRFIDAYNSEYQIAVASNETNTTNLVSESLLKPLNAKLGQPCLNLVSSNENQVTVAFDKTCADNAVLTKLQTLPPAALYDAPQIRQRSIIKNPETLKKLSI